MHIHDDPCTLVRILFCVTDMDFFIKKIQIPKCAYFNSVFDNNNIETFRF